MSELTFRSRTTSPSNESCQKGALANQLLTELASMLDQDKEAAPSSATSTNPVNPLSLAPETPANSPAPQSLERQLRQAREEGYHNGWNAGKAMGARTGFEKGRAMGYAEGLIAGRRRGKEENKSFGRTTEIDPGTNAALAMARPPGDKGKSER